MFDKLVESEPHGADFKNRRNYFMVSSLVVGVVFVTAVVVSIYAADIGLGNSSFELVEIIAPPDLATTQPDEAPPRIQRQNQAQSQLATRQVNMLRPDETPREIPTTISTSQNTVKARPYGDFVVNGRDDGPVGESTGRDTNASGPNGEGLVASTRAVAEKEPEPEPPPVTKPIDKKPVTQSLGVINGRAEYLPKPVYSAAAISVRAEGKVDVQVTIDETGRVIAANAVSGHPLLKAAAEQAARNARFSPTLLSKVPVKVTGVIVYNFTR